MLQITNSDWIWVSNWEVEDKEEARFVYFRKKITLEKVPLECIVDISADSRYKLYVNERLVEIGPSKGDQKVWFYDTVDLTPYLKEGVNVIAVIVLRYPMENNKGNHGIFRTPTPGLYLVGNYLNENQEQVRIAADESWKCYKELSSRIRSESKYFAPLQILEDTTGNAENFGWMRADYSDDHWVNAKSYTAFEIKKAISPGGLYPRTIPYMNKIPKHFQEVTVVRQSASEKAAWNQMLAGTGCITIGANSSEIVEINAGELMTGFLRLVMTEGKGTKIKILQSESYVQSGEESDHPGSYPKKGDRLDWENGHLHGYTDTYTVAGLGREGKVEIYEPFWFRTFRFIQLEIQTAEEPIRLEAFDYKETGYPLEVKTWVQTSDKSLEAIWDISERTLKRCMHETYEDCPFYEQLQYAMDTRSQMLYTYMTSADDRLARKGFDDFRRSARYDGMINCCYPSVGPNIIPGFSIYYIMMLYDHMMYFGDRKLIEFHMPTVDGILSYFNRQLTEDGIVGKNGGILFQDRYWSFIDWTSQWNETIGSPTAILQGPITIESLLYIMGLQHAAKLAAYMDREGVAKEYQKRAEAVQNAVRIHCIGANGMLQDGPGVEEYSQHCQVFAILTDTIDADLGKSNLQLTLQDKDNYAQCSVAMAFYLFRALEKTNLYEYTNELWDLWRSMLKKNLSTCVEDGVNERSDCHAWGALALFELPAVILGVRPSKPGFEEIVVKPVTGYLTWAKGEVITPKGMVKVNWKKVGEQIDLNYQLPIV